MTMTTPEKALPFSLEAECAVLGSLLIDPDALALVAASLRSQDFYRNTHATIYRAMLSYWHRYQSGPDFVTLCDELASRGELEAVGGASSVTALVNEVPTSGNLESYAAIVRRKATNRRLIATAGRIAACAYEEVEDALEVAESMVYHLRTGTTDHEMVPLSAIMGSFLTDLDRRHSEYGQIVGLSTGFLDLDSLLGGLQPGELIILGGRPGEGKTSFLLNVLHNILFTFGKNLVMFSLEMSRADLARRLVSMESGIDSAKLRNRTLLPDDWQAVMDAVHHLSDDHLCVDESSTLSIAALRAKCRRHQQKHGLDLVVVDYLQLMQGDPHATGDTHRHDRRQEIDEISRGLKQVARDLQVPVLACASLNRAVEGRADQTPKLSDLRESGSIESDADIVMFIRRARERAGYSLLNIEKHRNGPVGEVTLRFDASLTRFRDVDDESEDSHDGH